MTFTVVVPAAGVGRRMGADCPKQYLPLAGKFLIEHTLERLLNHPRIERVVVALNPADDFFATLPVASHPRLRTTLGADERAGSVMNGLARVETEWVLVHDAARPCLTHGDMDKLIQAALAGDGAILGSRVRDTMKRADAAGHIVATVERDHLWHALTPQMFRTAELRQALLAGLHAGASITDEASAMELAGKSPKMVEGRADNIKVTRPEDIALAALFLSQQEQLA
ncbi:2-C-methyl-D-erythritol 4-phosphate cytidylyltransferase [Pseudaeromonas paramecii]|uniref:2-C-methyl-D-erythritol 4-phosphate cytidylyltransferase n=1 Tax=Pseudaeromonas paramecii TaxID=2138166 RepID=A0ABP8QAC5_9GAMM